MRKTSDISLTLLSALSKHNAALNSVINPQNNASGNNNVINNNNISPNNSSNVTPSLDNSKDAPISNTPPVLNSNSNNLNGAPISNSNAREIFDSIDRIATRLKIPNHQVYTSMSNFKPTPSYLKDLERNNPELYRIITNWGAGASTSGVKPHGIIFSHSEDGSGIVAAGSTTTSNIVTSQDYKDPTKSSSVEAVALKSTPGIILDANSPKVQKANLDVAVMLKTVDVDDKSKYESGVIQADYEYFFEDSEVQRILAENFDNLNAANVVVEPKITDEEKKDLLEKYKKEKSDLNPNPNPNTNIDLD